MGLFSRKKPPVVEPPPEPKPTVQEALVQALVGALVDGFKNQLDGNAKIAGVFSDFTKSLGELTMRQAAQRLGSRGGRRSAERRAAQKVKSDCPLCRNPLTRNVTVPIIEAHRMHEQEDEIPQQLELNGNGSGNTAGES